MSYEDAWQAEADAWRSSDPTWLIHEGLIQADEIGFCPQCDERVPACGQEDIDRPLHYICYWCDTELTQIEDEKGNLVDSVTEPPL